MHWVAPLCEDVELMSEIDQRIRDLRGSGCKTPVKEAIGRVAERRGIEEPTLRRRRKRYIASIRLLCEYIKQVRCGHTPDPNNFTKIHPLLAVIAAGNTAEVRVWPLLPSNTEAHEMLRGVVFPQKTGGI
jgi:hypothetical protein